MKKNMNFILVVLLLLLACNTNPPNVEDADKVEDSSNEEVVPNSKDEKSVEFTKQDSLVMEFIALVRNNDKAAIAKMTNFPISREYPLSDIEDASDFMERYDQIFDDSIKQIIISSDPKKNWGQVGWRGIMLNSGSVWLDIDGNLLSVNYQSKTEKEIRNELIEKDRNTVHESLKDFVVPTAIMETEKFRIRIDEKKDYYRYASWGIDKEQSEEPDLIIEKGELVMDGSGGNHYYLFKNGDYTYQCYVIVLGARDSPLGTLKINKKDKEILSDDIIKMKR